MLSEMTCDWLKSPRHGLHFLMPEIWSQGERQKCNVLSDHLNYNMLKGYYGIFAQCQQK